MHLAQRPQIARPKQNLHSLACPANAMQSTTPGGLALPCAVLRELRIAPWWPQLWLALLTPFSGARSHCFNKQLLLRTARFLPWLCKKQFSASSSATQLPSQLPFHLPKHLTLGWSFAFVLFPRRRGVWLKNFIMSSGATEIRLAPPLHPLHHGCHGCLCCLCCFHTLLPHNELQHCCSNSFLIFFEVLFRFGCNAKCKMQRVISVETIINGDSSTALHCHKSC